MVLSLVSLLGCSGITGTRSSLPSLKIIKKAEIGSGWQMYQLEINAPADSELPILLKLADGDKVDGYYYLEEGNNLDFQIAGNSLIYKAEGQATGGSGKTASSRFSFVASDAQGKSYTLTLSNGAKRDKVTVFLEVIYPVSGSIFFPLETK